MKIKKRIYLLLQHIPDLVEHQIDVIFKSFYRKPHKNVIKQRQQTVLTSKEGKQII